MRAIFFALALFIANRAAASPIVVDREYTLHQLDALEKTLPNIAAKKKDALATARSLIAQLKQQLQGAVGATAQQLYPIDPPHFDQLLQKITATGLPRERLELVSMSAKQNHFLCEQASTLITLFPFPEDRMHVLTLLAPQLVDAQNNASILQLFPIPSDQDRAKALLGLSPAVDQHRDPFRFDDNH